MSHAVAVHPIRNQHDLHEALARIHVIWGAVPGTSAGDELDILLDLVEAYELRQHPVALGSGVRALKHLMQANGLTQSDLSDIGSQGVVSEILAGKRPLTIRHLRALAHRFGVPPAVFL